MRHSAAHVMAQAILRLYPDAKLTIGPVVEDGFYYDIDMPPVSEEDFPASRRRCKDRPGQAPHPPREVTKAEALDFYENEPYKLEMISRSAGRHHFLLRQGDSPISAGGPTSPIPAS
jgi:threonyl-tRNA synthetase